MNKIRFTANETTNYVFHMLSVAKCGYDNAYGEAYRSLYPAEDLAVLKEHEDLLIICGGVHCGALYPLLISGAARAEQPAEAYYAGLLRGTPAGLETHADAIRQISGVMLRHCGSYLTDIWPSEREKIAAYIPAVRRLFEDMDFTEKAARRPSTFPTSRTCSASSARPSTPSISSGMSSSSICCSRL